MSSHFLTFRPRRVAISLVAALVLVPVLAVVTKTVVEGLTSLVYEIHWLETVPALILATAFVVNAWLNDRAEASGDEP